MASKFTELVIDCREPLRVAEFWAAVLDYKITEQDDDDDDDVYIEGPEGSGPGIVLQKVPEAKTVKNRVHLDVNPADRDQADEVERLEALGATRVDVGQGDVSWVVMADVEDNEFCVLRTRVDQ